MVIRAASCLILLFCIAGQSFSSSAKVSVWGVIAESVTHISLFDATIIQDYPAANGIMLKDSVFSDSQGRFQTTLLDSTRFSHLLTIEKDGYRTKTVQLPSFIDSPTIKLDTVFLVPYTSLDSVTYMVSGSVTDSGREGVRGASVSILLTQNGDALFSVTVAASQWGGYFNVMCRQPYRAWPVTALVQVQAPGFNSADMTQTLASSSPDFVINPVLKSMPNSLSVPVPKMTKAAIPLTTAYTINGRKVETVRRGLPWIAVVRASPGGTGKVGIRLK